MDKGTKGASNELIATVWLLKKGYHVFRNVSPHGPVDLFAMKGPEIIPIDVKSGPVYKNRKMPRRLNREQIALGIKVIVVYPDGECVLDLNPEMLLHHEATTRICAECSLEFKSQTLGGRFCTRKCGQRHGNNKYRAKMALQRATNGP